jgi:hypothetical protein
LAVLRLISKLKTRGLLQWQIGWLRSFENFVYVHGGKAHHVPHIGRKGWGFITGSHCNGTSGCICNDPPADQSACAPQFYPTAATLSPY